MPIRKILLLFLILYSIPQVMGQGFLISSIIPNADASEFYLVKSNGDQLRIEAKKLDLSPLWEKDVEITGLSNRLGGSTIMHPNGVDLIVVGGSRGLNRNGLDYQGFALSINTNNQTINWCKSYGYGVFNFEALNIPNTNHAVVIATDFYNISQNGVAYKIDLNTGEKIDEGLTLNLRHDESFTVGELNSSHIYSSGRYSSLNGGTENTNYRAGITKMDYDLNHISSKLLFEEGVNSNARQRMYPFGMHIKEDKIYHSAQGDRTSNNPNNYEVYFSKHDLDLNLEFCYEYSFPEFPNERARTMEKLEDGFIMSKTVNNEKLIVFKVDFEGNIIWSKIIYASNFNLEFINKYGTHISTVINDAVYYGAYKTINGESISFVFSINTNGELEMNGCDLIIEDATINRWHYATAQNHSETPTITIPSTIEDHPYSIKDVNQVACDTFTAPESQTACPNTAINLMASGGDSYQWSPNIEISCTDCPNPTITASTSRTYQLTISSYLCCIDSVYFIDILVPKINSFDLGPDIYTCSPENYPFNAFVENATYNWHDGSTNSNYQSDQFGLIWVEIDSAGCVFRDSVEIFPRLFTPVDLGPDIYTCSLENYTFNAFIENATYTWHDGSTNESYTSTQFGLIWVEIDSAGCVFRDSVEIFPRLFTPVDLGPDIYTCSLENYTFIAFVENATYTWHDGSTNESYTSTQFGLIWVEIDSAGCVFRDSLQIIPRDFKPIDLGPDQYSCAIESAIFEAYVPNANYLWHNGSSGSSYESNQFELIWVEIDSAGCVFRDSVEIFPRLITPVDLGPDIYTCSPENYTFNVSVENATYNWHDGSTSESYTSNQLGLVWVEIDSAGCVFRDSVEIFPRLFTPVDLGPDIYTCSLENYTFNAIVENATYTWHDGSTNESYTSTQFGLIWVEIDSAGCVFRDSLQIIFRDFVPIDLGPDQYSCAIESAIFEADVPNANYLWHNGSSGSSYESNQFELIWVEIDSAGCVFRDSVYRIKEAIEKVDIGADTSFCPYFWITLDVSRDNATYLWQDGGTKPSRTISDSGFYKVTVFQSGCSTSDSLYVTLYDLPEIYLPIDTAICKGDSIIIDLSSYGYSYFWNNGSKESIVVIKDSGDYWVHVSNEECYTKKNLRVNFKTSPIITLGPDAAICPYDSLQIIVDAQWSSYLWNTGDTSNSITVKDSGVYILTTYEEGCTFSDTIEIDLKNLPIIELGNDTSICPNDTLFLDASNTGASYLWNDNSTDSSLLALDSGIYFVKVDLDGCNISDTINLSYYNLPLFNLPPDTTVCQGDSVQIEISGNNHSYLWNDGNQDSSRYIREAGIYWVRVFDGNCSAIDSIELRLNTTPFVELGNDTNMCGEAQFAIHATYPNAEYLWNTGSTDSVIQIDTSGNYSVLVSFNGCTALDSIQIEYFPFPKLDLGADTSICEGDTIYKTLNEPTWSYFWDDGSTDSFKIISDSGSYHVTVFDGFCSSQDTINVSKLYLPFLSLVAEMKICEGSSTIFDPLISYVDSMIWNDSSTNTSLIANTPGLYWVTGYNSCGMTSDSILLISEFCGCNIYIPNTFSPNNDGLNESFKPELSCIPNSYQLQIYDRWGKLIFETNNYLESWAGFNGSKESKTDVYAYKVIVQFAKDAPKKIINGRVTAID